MSGAGYTSPTQSGLTILPSPTTFQQYSIQAAGNVQLQWPTDNFPANSSVVALLMSISPLGTGCTMQMPNATYTSLGEKCLFFNAGSVAFNVISSTGGAITPVQPGAAIYIALINNLTAGGHLADLPSSGPGLRAANAAALAQGRVLQPPRALLRKQIMQVTTVSTNYAITAADRDNLLNWTGGAGTLTLPAASLSANNFYIQIRNSGSGALTITPAGADQINGTNSLTMNVSDSCFLVTDGTGWFTIGLGSINTNIFNFQIVSLAGQSGTYVLPSNQQNKVAYRFTGALAGNTIIQVPATIQQYWVDNECTGGTLAIGTATQIAGAQQFPLVFAARYILYCDGVNVPQRQHLWHRRADLDQPRRHGSATTASQALINLGGTSLGIAVFTATSVTSAQASIQVLSASDAWAISLTL